mgnify:CR=1 FL=1
MTHHEMLLRGAELRVALAAFSVLLLDGGGGGSCSAPLLSGGWGSCSRAVGHAGRSGSRGATVLELVRCGSELGR